MPKRLRKFLVYYSLPGMTEDDNWLAYEFSAVDKDHAREQFMDAEPTATVEAIRYKR